MRLLMIGPMPPPLGGTTVSFKELCEFLQQRGQDLVVINTVSENRSRFIEFLIILTKLVWHGSRTDIVSLHCSDRGTVTLGPAVWIICRILRKPLIFRQFGGEFMHSYHSLEWLHKWIVSNTILSSDAVLLQTKSMIKELSSIVKNIYWFPTARKKISENYNGSYAQRRAKLIRCVFLGHVSRAKGVLDAVKAVNGIDNATLDIYGPIIDVQKSDIQHDRVNYRGLVSPNHVGRTLAQYDLLLFPTKHTGEGYSGTLVEASMVGLPIIATRWQSLPEMFTDDEVFFVDPKEPFELQQAIQLVVSKPSLLVERSKKLKIRSVDYEAETIFANFHRLCSDVWRKGTS